MSHTKQIKYNLPGVGNINVNLFPYGQKVWDFLDHYGHIKRLKKVNQLGSLRLVYNGAHHSRYEYLITQLAIISELCKFKGPQDQRFSLGSEIDDFGSVASLNKHPTKGDVLQIYAILSNIGHLPGTFSSERALLSYLKSDSELKRVFKYGLSSEDYDNFEEVVDNFSIYKFNTLIASFLLGRYQRKDEGKEIANLCRSIIRSYNNYSSEEDERTKHMWRLYKALRRFVYLALDSLYAPVPFSIDINSLILSIDQYLEDIFTHESPFQIALGQIEDVMRDSIYLSSNSLLQLSKTSNDVIISLDTNREKFSTTSGMKKLLFESDLSNECFEKREEIGEKYKNEKLILSCAYKFDRALSKKVVNDTVKWEDSISKRVGRSYCRIGMEWDPTQEFIRITASLNSEKSFKTKNKTAYNIVQQFLKFDLEVSGLSGLGPGEKWTNHMALLKYLSKATFGWEYKYQFRTKPVTEKVYPVVIEYGSTKSSIKLKEYINEIGSEMYESDELNELKMVSKSLENLNYRGLLISFHDAVVITNQERELVEFDGLIFLLGKHKDDISTIVVEGKNKPNGHTEAGNELREKFGELDIEHHQIVDLPTKGAFATLKL